VELTDQEEYEIIVEILNLSDLSYIFIMKIEKNINEKIDIQGKVFVLKDIKKDDRKQT